MFHYKKANSKLLSIFYNYLRNTWKNPLKIKLVFFVITLRLNKYLYFIKVPMSIIIFRASCFSLIKNISRITVRGQIWPQTLKIFMAQFFSDFFISICFGKCSSSNSVKPIWLYLFTIKILQIFYRWGQFWPHTGI